MHRANLVRMGVLPPEIAEGVDRITLGIGGMERLSLPIPLADLAPRQHVPMLLHRRTEPASASRLAARRYPRRDGLSEGGRHPALCRTQALGKGRLSGLTDGGLVVSGTSSNGHLPAAAPARQSQKRRCRRNS
ncbi:hypothetical protein [Ancylobacter sp. FA202]|uniref:hypothetical protein n=1 Tax=Ancylobacter sp. FA202 TaxID=1111106 RepID=UPI0035273C2E